MAGLAAAFFFSMLLEPFPRKAPAASDHPKSQNVPRSPFETLFRQLKREDVQLGWCPEAQDALPEP